MPAQRFFHERIDIGKKRLIFEGWQVIATDLVDDLLCLGLNLRIEDHGENEEPESGHSLRVDEKTPQMSIIRPTVSVPATNRCC